MRHVCKNTSSVKCVRFSVSNKTVDVCCETTNYCDITSADCYYISAKMEATKSGTQSMEKTRRYCYVIINSTLINLAFSKL